MGLRIATNVASLAAQRHLARNEKQTSHAIRALASGSRIVDAGDDAAGFAISESLRGQAASLSQARRNADSALGLVQVAEGGLSEQNNILVRLRELAVQSASDTVGDDERQFLQTEFGQLVNEFDRISETTSYGKKKLLAGMNEEFVFQLGTGGTENDVIRFSLDADTRSGSLGLTDLSVKDKDRSRKVMETLDKALLDVARARAGFGAIQSRLDIAGNNLDIQHENVMAARSRIADADVAHEAAELAQGKIAQEFATAVLAQANQNAQSALRLVG
jgi:flagellin